MTLQKTLPKMSMMEGPPLPLTQQDWPHDLAEDLAEDVHAGGVHPRLPVLVTQVVKELLQELRVVDAADNFLQRFVIYNCCFFRADC